MSVPYLLHRSVAGDRWDLLAWRYYGDPTLFGPMVLVNTAVPISSVLSPGTDVMIPILQAASAEVATPLPPWRKQ
jgi:phage tail protein X